ncbi:hypothetical protein, variant [Blastomyces gilchristii SLH14081]|uniref:Uncharacterized protein n=1 Tax=Blastomyces gilchristii (strain SLH14081) TaxID=559298 RepID=A0A179UZD7_BLAGS|nr:uncharacterized protein BDBG_07810 [Blastomyces gilchristii SLH14081]XP_031580401.1 hypothetical protein, variant [Blastomyces gilchristii SLH14081]EQL27838.1 hypothetical protein BDFG_09360 [Blastomyces dermatitidis ATCC 26199]OAT12476.1 hypothetical protein BDBG_07810 [Blastomyces gilchristii SLH14081]OAT12477.1 hypothetical protein, variant [Blastomyces gilchristii SLH14081]
MSVLVRRGKRNSGPSQSSRNLELEARSGRIKKNIQSTPYRRYGISIQYGKETTQQLRCILHSTMLTGNLRPLSPGLEIDRNGEDDRPACRTQGTMKNGNLDSKILTKIGTSITILYYGIFFFCFTRCCRLLHY